MPTDYTGDPTQVSDALSRTISNATNASPIVVTTTVAHLFATNDRVRISGVLGNAAANGDFVITKVNATSFALNGSTGNGAYSGGPGTVVDKSLTPQIQMPSNGDGPGISADDVAPMFQGLSDRSQKLEEEIDIVEDDLATETAARIAGDAATLAAAETYADAYSHGRLIKVSVLTSLSATFTTQATTKECRIRGWGPGGGGGGVTNGAGAGAAGGGGDGSYVEKLFACDPSTGYAYTNSAGGVGNSGAGGSAGTDATFDANGTTVTAKSGNGAPGAVPQAVRTITAGATGGTASTNGDVNGVTGPGAPGVVVETSGSQYAVGGDGGSTLVGAGGKGATANGNGSNASGYGAGGGGAISNNTTARKGGDGTPSLWIVEEYS